MPKGVETPRIWTPAKRKLTKNATMGHQVIEFGRSLGVEFMPWQQWVLKHGLELNEDGSYRFRTVLVICARQNGKTTIPKVLSLWRMMQHPKTLVLGTSTNLEYARESWGAAADLAEEELKDQLAPGRQGVSRGSVNTQIKMRNNSRYKIAAANRRGGRSLSLDLGIADELREHSNWEAWGALSGATTATPNPQIWSLTNAGDDTSVVLNHFRESALAHIETGEGDDSFALFEWSAPEDCDLDDPKGWAQANPALGYTITNATLRSKLASLPPAVFRTEHLCQRVASMDGAVDLAAWQATADSGTLDNLRDKIALCLDVSLDLQHVTLVAAAVTQEGSVRVEVVEAWDSVNQARSALPALLEKVNPRVIGWFPRGPGATLATDLKITKRAETIKSEDIPAVCLGLAEQVSARKVLHPADQLLAAQLAGTAKVYAGDGWRFARRGAGHCDAVYALAGAVHLARSLPPPPPPLVVL